MVSCTVIISMSNDSDIKGTFNLNLTVVVVLLALSVALCLSLMNIVSKVLFLKHNYHGVRLGVDSMMLFGIS